MSRLTKKETNTLSSYGYRTCEYLLNGTPRVKALNKLGKLEDLEDELGCPLEVREKAFDNGFYDENGKHYFCEHYVPYLKEMHTSGIINGTSKRFRLKDYGKTWWLKNDRSE